MRADGIAGGADFSDLLPGFHGAPVHRSLGEVAVSDVGPQDTQRAPLVGRRPAASAVPAPAPAAGAPPVSPGPRGNRPWSARSHPGRRRRPSRSRCTTLPSNRTRARGACGASRSATAVGSTTSPWSLTISENSRVGDAGSNSRRIRRSGRRRGRAGRRRSGGAAGPGPRSWRAGSARLAGRIG